MLSDAGLKHDTKLDLIYKAICSSKKMELDTFLQSLVKVAELSFHDVVDDSHTALRALLDHHMLPLYTKLVKREMGDSELIYDELTERALKDVATTLFLVFRVYLV